MDPDLNKYDLHHITAGHSRMTKEEWAHAYDQSWRRYYTFEHCERIMRRAAALKAFGSVLFTLTWFKASYELENVHPVESGLVRLKFRRDRRSTLPIEPIWSFYPKYFSEVARKSFGWIRLYMQLRRIYLRIKHDPKRYEYTDAAIEPVADDEVQTHQMFHTDAARAYVSQERQLENARHGAMAQ
jgi:hypothetical protein